MTTERTVPIYEVGELRVDPLLNQKFFPRKSQAEKYERKLLAAGMTPYLKEHRISLNRDGICGALNELPNR